MGAINTKQTSFVNQRRSQRILLAVPVQVTGKHAEDKTFSERTKTLVVSAHGALVLLKATVTQGDSLTLQNLLTKEEAKCRVADVTGGQNGWMEIGVEFLQPNPRFWRVAFPPEDWSPHGPESKRFVIGKQEKKPVVAGKK